MKIINTPCGITKAMKNILASASILFISLVILPVSMAYAQISTSEREALIALYNSTDGDNWANNTGWLGAVGTECGWNGVTCSGGAVVILSLPANNLIGTIPPELGNLSNISRIILPLNQLSSSIPAELGNLSTLNMLVLYSNQLTGTIPAELGNLSSLTDLYLYDNQLTGRIPTELADLSSSGAGSLVTLDICDNHLYAIDSDLRLFLDNYQSGWEDCQTPPFGKPMPSIPLLLLDD